MVLCTLALAVATRPRVVPVELWSIPFNGPRGDVYGTQATPDGKKVAFTWPAPNGGQSWTYVVDTHAHAVQLFARGAFINGNRASEGQDCLSGLVTIASDESPEANGGTLFTATTYDLATDRKLSTVRVHNASTLVGRILTDDWVLGQEGIQEYDVRTGQKRADLPESYLARRVRPVWDSPASRLYMVSPQERYQSDFGNRYLVRFNAGSVTPSAKAYLTDSFYPWVVGNPDTGDFAILGNRDATERFPFLLGLFRADLTRLPIKLDWVSDVSSRGVLGERGTRDPRGRWNLSQLVCVEPMKGSVLWKAKTSTDGWTGAPRWIGQNVLANDNILDGRNGRFLGKLNLPFGRALNWHDNVVVRMEGKTTHRIVAYRVDSVR
ncbi:MAG: hypothetical protein ACHQ50_05335 [Fimbriimonadales bacterium]